MSINRRIDKEYMVYYTHTHNEILLSHKKNEIMPSAATWKDPDYLSKSER